MHPMNNEPLPPAKPSLEQHRKLTLGRLLAPSMDTFGLSRGAALTTILSIGAAVLLAVFWFFASAPPKTITITSGTPGSIFQTNAERYRAILASNGVTLKILPSKGALENLQRLKAPSFRVD